MEVNGWMLVDEKEVSQEQKELTEGEMMLSFIWHECEALRFEFTDEELDNQESEVRYLDAEDSIKGKCWFCMADAPPELHSVWMIHNMDIIPRLRLPADDQSSWSPKYVKMRLTDIERNKDEAIKSGHWKDDDDG